MKSPRIFYLAMVASLVLGGLALTLAHGAISLPSADASATKAKGAAAGTNSAQVPLPIAVSVFDVSLNPTKDPFFPNSVRQPIPQKTNLKPAPNITAGSLKLMALSGSTDSRLAMINHRTLAIGEAVEVTTFAGSKATIRLLEIKENSVVIRVISPAQPDLIELSLSKGAQ